MMKSLISSALALAALGVVSAAQSQQATPVKVQGTPQHATIKMATGELIRGSAQDKAAGLTRTWINTDYSGYYGGGAVTSEVWLDWGMLTTAGSDIVSGYQFAYGTTALDTSVGGPGVDLCTDFYAGATGWCNDGGMVPTQQYCFDDLPGSTTGGGVGWIITVDTSCGFEFLFPGGPFGFSLNFQATGTGPLLCYAGDAPYGNNTDSNGQDDAFDIYNPDLATGTCPNSWFFGGWPLNIASWWMYLEQADPSASDSASCGVYCGGNVNQNGFTVTANAVLGGTFSSNVDHDRTGGAVLYAYDGALTFNWKGEQILIDFTSPNGMLYGTPPLTFGDPAFFDLPVPLNLCLVGFTFYTQAAAFGGGITLQCAYACTIGF